MASGDGTDALTVGKDREVPSEDQFFQRLRSFPNLFFQQCTKKASRSRLKHTLCTIKCKQERRQQGPVPDLDDEEDPQDLGIFLQWILGDASEAGIQGERAEAERKAARAVMNRPKSLLAQSNQAYILWHKGQRDSALEQLCALENLRKGGTGQYEKLEMEALSEVLYLYIKLGYLFKPYAVSELQEKLLARRPNDDSAKFTLGLTYRRYTNHFWTQKHPHVDFTHALRRAIELFVEVKDNEDNSDDLRARAAAELGESLNWQHDKKLKAVVEDEKTRRGIRADQCFQEAARLTTNNPSALVSAGKYFRYKDPEQSREYLEKAVTIRSEAKAHHQLGLTLRQLVLQRQSESSRSHGIRETGAGNDVDNGTHPGGSGRDEGSLRTSGGGGRGGRERNRAANQNRGNRNPGHQRVTIANGAIIVLSRNNETVGKIMQHFERSLELNHEGFFAALFDLGLIHFSLKEYQQALTQYQKASELCSEHLFNFSKVMHHTSLVLAEMDYKNPTSHQEMMQFCAHLGLSSRCRLLLQEQRIAPVNTKVWFSFHSLQTTLQRQFWELTRITEKEEGALLRNLKTFTSTLSVLDDIFSYSPSQAVDSNFLENAVREYLGQGCFHDALLFLFLLKLTSQNHVICSWQEPAILVKTQMLVARDRLLLGAGKVDVESKINITAARMLFRHAFEDLFPNTINTESCGQQQAAASQRVSRPGEQLPPAHTSSQPASPESSTQATSQAGEHLMEPELDDDVKGITQVLLVYEPRKGKASSDVRNLQDTLQDVFGLQTSLLGVDTERGSGHSALTDKVTEAQLTVFVVETSEFGDLITEAAVALTSASALGTTDQSGSWSSSIRQVALLMNRDTGPSALQGYRSFSWSSEQLHEGQQWSRSEDGARTCCQLFCGLMGIDIDG